MKRGILSIVISFIGFYLLYDFNIKLYTLGSNILSGRDIRLFPIDELLSFQKLTKIISISIALLSLYLGLISFLKRNKIGLIGIILSILLLIFSFVPFWKYVLEDSTLDINF